MLAGQRAPAGAAVPCGSDAADVEGWGTGALVAGGEKGAVRTGVADEGGGAASGTEGLLPATVAKSANDAAKTTRAPRMRRTVELSFLPRAGRAPAGGGDSELAAVVSIGSAAFGTCAGSMAG